MICHFRRVFEIILFYLFIFIYVQNNKQQRLKPFTVFLSLGVFSDLVKYKFSDNC